MFLLFFFFVSRTKGVSKQSDMSGNVWYYIISIILRVETVSTPLALCLSFVSISSTLWFKWLPLNLNMDLAWYSEFPLNWSMPNIYFKNKMYLPHWGWGLYLPNFIDSVSSMHKYWFLSIILSPFATICYILHQCFPLKSGKNSKCYINKHNHNLSISAIPK